MRAGLRLRFFLREHDFCHTGYGMKMTMHIDEGLLARVMELYACESKTEAVDFALREMERRHLLRGYAKTGLGLSALELKEGVAPGYNVLAARHAGKPPSHGKRRSR
jgi:Arc/MetJ family transcription regulator